MNPSRTPGPVAENEGIAFPGVHVATGLIVSAEDAQRMLAARNRHGKPNADVLRPYVDAADPAWRRDASGRRWVVDFPADLTPEEASLYAEPWNVLAASGGHLHERSDPMRIAIARIDSYLAAPMARVLRGFLKVGSETLPGAGLVVVASDDDFVGAVLQSGVFAAWVDAHGGVLRVAHVASFPFPWPPHSERGSLSRLQLELRDSVVRAGGPDLNDAVAVVYGWSGSLDTEGIVSELRSLNLSRRAAEGKG